MSKDLIRALRFAVAGYAWRVEYNYLKELDELQEFSDTVGILELVYFCNHGVYP